VSIIFWSISYLSHSLISLSASTRFWPGQSPAIREMVEVVYLEGCGGWTMLCLGRQVATTNKCPWTRILQSTIKVRDRWVCVNAWHFLTNSKTIFLPKEYIGH
jgi:hypothetical protein